jgi:hypothetical protein|tara:strand:- start:159 stop:557 length:399 start_codon:yes stop_codon:yes gene_type:complete
MFSKIELPSNRKFGFFFTSVFILCGIFLFVIDFVSFSFLFFVLASLFLAVTLLQPDLLLSLNKLWTKFGVVLGLIISPIILGIIFFGLFTTTSLLMKLFGRDELRLKIKNRKSYWKRRTFLDRRTDAFKQQF